MYTIKILAKDKDMKKSTKILLIIFIAVLIPSLVLGNSIFQGIKPTDNGFTFNFDVKGYIAFALNIIALILGNILFVRFLLSLPLDKMLFFSTVPLILIYGTLMFLLAEMSNFNNPTATSVRNLLNISQDNPYNKFLWAILLSLAFVLIFFLIFLFMCKPITRVEKVVLRLGDGKVKQDRFSIGKGKQFNSIEHGLNKINNNYKEKDNSLKKVSLETKKFVPKQFFKFLGKNNISELELGNQVKKQATIINIKLVGINDNQSLSLEDNFNFLNSYLNVIAPHIRKLGGFIDKYLGDGVLAVFGKAEDALKCAHVIKRAIDIKNRQNKTLPNIGIRMAIMSSEVIFGIVGEEERKIPTIVSDEMKLLEKIDEICRYISANVIFTKHVIDQLPLTVKINYRYVGSINEGDYKDLMLFEDLEVYPRDEQSGLLKHKDRFEKGVILYENGKYEECYHVFTSILRNIPSDKASYIYFNKCKEKL